VSAPERQGPRGPEPDDELAPVDDAVIGRAVRRSLLAVVVLGAAVAAFFLLGDGRSKRVEERAVAATPPRTHAAAAEVGGALPAVPFTDQTAAAGIDFVHATGATGEKLLPESLGGGVAAFDADADGDSDLLFVDSGDWPWSGGPKPALRLYRNDAGKGAWRFVDVTAEAGLGNVRLYGMGVAVGDVDGDGREDLLVTAVGENRLLRNVSAGGAVRFAELPRAGVEGSRDDWHTCATFLDVDRDGDLDLFICRYVRWSRQIDLEVDFRLDGVGRAYGPPTNYEGTDALLFENDGAGRFVDISAAAGVRVANPATGRPVGKALGVLAQDLDRDGWVDVVVANDTTANFYFRNRGDRTFEEIGIAAGLAFDRMGAATGAMGIDAGAFRDPGELAIAIGNFANEMTSFYVNQGDGLLWTDEAISVGIGAPSRRALTFGVLFLDADLDGRLDLVAANGHLETGIAQVDPSQTYLQAAQFFWNAGPEARQAFALLPADAVGDLGRPVAGRGLATADFDGDGDGDLVLTQVGGPPLLLRNEQATGHHWLVVRLADPAGNRLGLGAEVELRAGGRVQRRTISPTRSYLSQCETVARFGLGTSPSVEALVVRWPDGEVQEVETSRLGAVDTTLVVERRRAGASPSR
jgi:hypothetical protein